MPSIFDDVSFGSAADQAAAVDAMDSPFSLGYTLPADATEASAVAWSVPSVLPVGAGSTDAAAQPWWQGVIKYGLTRAIDNTFQKPAVTGNVAPGSFAGQNGVSYDQYGRPIQSRQTGVRALDQSTGGGLGLLLLAGLAFVAVEAGG
jgi:hypothetical protein